MSASTTKKFFDKSEVEDLVKKNDKYLSFAKPPCGKRAYWDKYQEVLINNVRQKCIISHNFKFQPQSRSRPWTRLNLNFWPRSF